MCVCVCTQKLRENLTEIHTYILSDSKIYTFLYCITLQRVQEENSRQN